MIVSEYDQEIPQSQTADNPRGTARKSRSTITRHQEDKLSKATCCESLNEPLHLRCGSYLHEQIDLSHTHIQAI